MQGQRPGGTYWSNLLWFAAAVVSVGVGIVCFGVWITRPHFGDAKVVLDAGDHFAAGMPLYSASYAYEFLYPPLAAVVGSVLRLLPDWLLIEFSIRLVVMSGGAWLLTRGHSLHVRALGVLVAVTAMPFVEDLLEGNEATWLAVAVACVTWRRDSLRAGVPLGLVLALFAKPQLLPFLVWMLVWRRRALVGTVISGGIATAIGAVVAGPAAYVDWLRFGVSQIGPLSSGFPGSQGLTAYVGPWEPLVLAVLLVGLVVALWRLDEDGALLWALATGVLILPYAIGHALMPLLAAARRLSQLGPLLAAAAPFLVLAIPAPAMLIVLAGQLKSGRRARAAPGPIP